MSPNIRVASNYSCVRAHHLIIAPRGTSREKNTKISVLVHNYNESTEKKSEVGKLHTRPILLVYSMSNLGQGGAATQKIALDWRRLHWLCPTNRAR